MQDEFSEHKIIKMVKKFAEELAKHKKLGLISHISPDGDAIGSQLALYSWLRNRAIEPLLFNDDPIPANLAWIKYHDKIQVPTGELLDECDGFVFIDGNQPSRFGKMEEYFEKTGKPVYLIDHHPDPAPDFFAIKLWDAGASSTAYLVYRMFEATDLAEIDKDVAEALYCGILTDTGSFRFDSVTAETHFAVGEIIRRGGIRPVDQYDRIYDDKSLAQYHLLGRALHNIRLFYDDRVAVTHITEAMLEETGCTHDDLEGFVNYPLSISGVRVSAIFYERDNRIKISLRGKGAVDLNQVARKFNGGGHVNAAGAWHPGPMQEAMDKVVAEIAARL